LPANAIICNELGNRIGWTDDGWVNEITGADLYLKDEGFHGSETYILPKASRYDVTIVGQGTGVYRYSMLSCINGTIRYLEFRDVETDNCVQDKYVVGTDISMVRCYPSTQKDFQLIISSTVNESIQQKIFTDIRMEEKRAMESSKKDGGKLRSMNRW